MSVKIDDWAINRVKWEEVTTKTINFSRNNFSFNIHFLVLHNFYVFMSRHIFWTILKWYELKIISIGSHQIYSSLIELEIEGRWLNFMSFLCTFFFCLCDVKSLQGFIFCHLIFLSLSWDLQMAQFSPKHLYSYLHNNINNSFFRKGVYERTFVERKKETLKVQMTTFFLFAISFAAFSLNILKNFIFFS